MKYKSRLVIKEAIRYMGPFSFDEMKEAWGSEFLQNAIQGLCGLYLKTLEGYLFPRIGDYIVKGVKGEFYPVKPDIFEMSYEKVENE
jgi:hypothetical protein